MITLAGVRRALRGHRPQPADAPDARPAAVALVLLEDQHGLEVLLIRRAERTGDPWSGQIALPRRVPLVASDEVQRAFWLPLARLFAPGVRREITVTLSGAERTFPAYLVDEDVIWGMTERILTPFLGLVAPL